MKVTKQGWMPVYKDAENPNCRIGGAIFPTKLLAQEANMFNIDKLVDIVYVIWKEEVPTTRALTNK